MSGAASRVPVSQDRRLATGASCLAGAAEVGRWMLAKIGEQSEPEEDKHDGLASSDTHIGLSP